jgi:3-deoxy-7-phosphoheptulonate synthase
MRSNAWVSLHPYHAFSWHSWADSETRNTHSTSTGLKTRSFASIFAELNLALKIHKEHGSYMGGVHLELTGEAVTECIGGSEGLEEEDLNLNYTTFCDPRLNEKQALELAFLIAEHHRAEDDDGDVAME